jgi:hypothetical protein
MMVESKGPTPMALNLLHAIAALSTLDLAVLCALFVLTKKMQRTKG